MKRFGGIVALFLAVAGALALTTVAAANGPPLLAEYPVPGNPLHVSVEAPGRIWFTLPDQNWIGHLWVTSTVDYAVVTYTVPSPGSTPYDLKYAGGAVWFTEQMGNRIGRLDPSTGAVVEFPVPTSASQPTGIDILAGNPTVVWFTERSGNKLGRLVVTSTTNYTFTEFSISIPNISNAAPEDLHIQNADSIWFTAPNASRIGNLQPSSGAFGWASTGGGSQPWAIKVDSEGYPWFTELTGDRIGQFVPTTLSDIRWYSLTASSDPYDIAIGQGFIWFTEKGTHRVGQLNPDTGTIREFGLPSGGAPTGLAVDSSGCVWIAESGRSRIAQWCPPYFRFVYLPLVLRNFGP